MQFLMSSCLKNMINLFYVCCVLLFHSLLMDFLLPDATRLCSHYATSWLIHGLWPRQTVTRLIFLQSQSV